MGETRTASKDQLRRRQPTMLGRLARLRREHVPDSAFYVIPSSAATVLTFLLVGTVILELGLYFSTQTIAHHHLATKNYNIQKLNERAAADLLVAVYTHNDTYLHKSIADVNEIIITVNEIVPELSADVREEFLAFIEKIEYYYNKTMEIAVPLFNNKTWTSESDIEAFHYNLKMTREFNTEGYSIITDFAQKAIDDDDRIARALMVISTILSFAGVPVTILVGVLTICCDYKNKRRLQRVHTEQLHETLHDEDERERFLSFCKKEYSAENLLCWVEIAEYQQLDDPEARCMKVRRIFDEYLMPHSPSQVNIELSGVNEIKRKLQAIEAKKSEPEITLFDGIAQELEKNMQDTHARYKKFKQSIIREHKNKFHHHHHLLHHHTETNKSGDAPIEMETFGASQRPRAASTIQQLDGQQQQQQQ